MKKIKYITFIILILTFLVTVSSCANNENSGKENDAPAKNIIESEEGERDSDKTIEIDIKIGNKSFDAELFKNKTTKELIEKMPLKINMKDMNANEKFYYFEDSLPSDAKRIGKINSGDIMLYGSDCIVIFYEEHKSSYSYTRLGCIKNIKDLKKAMGNGDVEISFMLKGD